MIRENIEINFKMIFLIIYHILVVMNFAPDQLLAILFPDFLLSDGHNHNKITPYVKDSHDDHIPPAAAVLTDWLNYHWNVFNELTHWGRLTYIYMRMWTMSSLV